MIIFSLHIHLKYITDVPFIGYPDVQGSPLQASERPGQAILPPDKASLDLLVQRTTLFEVKVKNIM